MGIQITSFSEIDWHDFTYGLSNNIKQEIESQTKDYILKVEEDNYKSFLIQQFKLEELEILNETEEVIPSTSKESKRDPHSRRSYERDVYNFVIRYSFSGSPILFRIHPSSFTVTANHIYLNENTNKVSYNFSMTKKDKDLFNRLKSQGYNDAFTNMGNINAEVVKWNTQLPSLVTTLFDSKKKKYLEENDFFKEINAKVNPNTSLIYEVPTIKKKVIPKPEENNKTVYHEYPTMSMEMYNDVIKVIYSAGKGMERKPSLYKDKEEEELRDQFLFFLETRYEGTTATGETFNRKGKTDILLKYAKDGTNLFVAECKFWHGKEELFKAIDQLFENYLTWRDSKTALIVFVKNKDFTKVLDTTKKEIINHPLYSKQNGEHGETSFSYLFNLPQDEDKIVYLEVILFHYDQ